ncbi:MAG TPA: M56 family metallopeptidase [Thermoanaerobaculia bacterium]|nr:M56 family metallopeptidase [Thermoanaerobaculia bacterium]
MNAMQWLTGPLAHAIGWALLHLLWQGVIVAAILGAALALLSKRSANVRYAVSCAALALLLVLGVITAYRAYEPPPAPSVASNMTTVPVTNPTAVIATIAAVTLRESATDVVLNARDWLPMIVTLWLAGVVFLSLRLLLSWMRAQRLVRRDAVPASAAWQQTARRLSHSIGLTRAVRLLESAAVEVPSVIGSLRPVILIPAATLTGLTAEQLEMVLAHELAHIRRHDFFVNLLQALVETLMFYHPAVWWISHCVRVEREHCCDDLALAVCGNPLQYARALTRLEELRADALPIAVAANGGSLLERIRRIAGARAEASSSTSRWAAAIAVLTVVALLVIVPSFPALAQRDTPKAKSAEKAKAAKTEVEVRADRDSRSSNDADTDVDSDDDDDDSDAWAPEPPEPPSVPDVPEAYVSVPEPPEAPSVASVDHVVQRTLAALNFEDDRDRNHDDEADDRDDDERTERRADGKLTIDELVTLRASGITPEYIAEMRTLFPNASIRELSKLKMVGGDAQYVRAMQAAGLTISSVHEYTSLRAVDVTPEYIKEMRGIGINITTAHDARQLRAVDVTPAFVKQLADAGYKDLSIHELTRLAAVGVDGDFIREMSKYKDKDNDKSKNK